MKVRIAAFILGLAAAAVVWLVVAGDGGSVVDGDAAGDGATEAVEVRAPEVGGEDGADDAGADESRTTTERETVGPADVVGTLVVQADEIDQCIDVRGSWLVLDNRTTGERHRAVILENGGAAFEGIRFRGARTMFDLRTEVADRACFPATFPIDRDDVTGDPPAAAVSVALIHLHGLTGVVRDANTRRPVVGARVEVDAFEMIGTVTGDDGRYTLELPDPRGTLVVTAPGYQELLWRFPEDTDAGTWLPDRRDFELLPDRLTAWVDVTATLADGSPAAGAEVEVLSRGRHAPPTEALAGMSVGERRRFLESLEADIGAFGVAGGYREEVAGPLDRDGRALLRLRLPGGAGIVVTCGDEMASAAVDVEAGERVELELSLRPASTLELELTEQGEPLAGRWLAVTWDDGVRLPRMDERGLATVSHVQAGVTVQVEAAVPSRLRLEGDVRFETPRDGGVVPVRLVAHRVVFSPVAGGVFDARTGDPIAFAEVAVEDPPALARTDQDGRFELRTREDAVLRIGATDYRGATVRRIGASSEVTPVRLEPFELDPMNATALVWVRAVDTGGEPLEGVTVDIERGWLESESGETISKLPRVTGVTGSNGILVPTLGWPVAAGEAVDLRLRGRGTSLFGAVRVRAEAGQERPVDLVMRRTAGLAGTVFLDGGDLPVGRIQVTWIPRAGKRRQARSGSDGRFVFSSAPSGPGVLRATMPFRGVDLELDLPEDGLSGVVLRLEPRDDP